MINASCIYTPSENRIRDFPNRHFHRIIEVKLVVVQLLKYKYDVFINK